MNLAWTIELTSEAIKVLKKLGHPEAKRIRDFLRKRIEPLENPRLLGKSLKGSEMGTFWRYRVGDYRIICEIQDDRLVVLVVGIGHRKKIYR